MAEADDGAMPHFHKVQPDAGPDGHVSVGHIGRITRSWQRLFLGEKLDTRELL